MSLTAFRILLRLCLLLLVLRAGTSSKAQLCTGSLGDPVVNITFGAGANPGAALPGTNYTPISVDCPQDGQYTVRNRTDGCFGNSWHSITRDHTDDENGYFMLVNASFQPGDFYRTTVKGLCGNTTYEFAAWVVNVLRTSACGGMGIRPNLTFHIETPAGVRINSFSTDEIEATSLPEWKQYGMFFTTPANIGDVVVRITNNAPGGCGNDIALDDITFRPCGAAIQVGIEGQEGDRLELCAGTGASRQFTATVSADYVDPELQWQESRNGGTTWTSIAGAQTTRYTWTENGAGTFHYRILVAERGNINSASCRIASKPLRIQVEALPQITLDETAAACAGGPLTLAATGLFANPEGASVRWQTPSTGGFSAMETREGNTWQLLLSKMPLSLSDSGQYTLQLTSARGCAESRSVRLNINAKPQAEIGQEGIACTGAALQFAANAAVANSTITAYGWNWNGATTGTEAAFRPVAEMPGTYPLSLWVRSAAGCTSDTLLRQVVVHPDPTAAFDLPDVCLADPFAPFINRSEVAGGGALAYRWAFGDPANPGFTTNEKDPRYRYPAVGQYAVRLTVTGPGGCQADTTRTVTVNGSRPRSIFSLPVAAVRCSADSVVLRNDSEVDFGSITRLEIFWKNDADASARMVDEAPFPGKMYRFHYGPFFQQATQTFTIRVVAYSGETCFEETLQSITVHRTPAVTFSPVAGLCQNLPPVLLTQGQETTGLAGEGLYNGSGTASNGSFSPAGAGPGTHVLTYRFTSSAGCADTAQTSIQVWPQPEVNAGPDRTVIAGGSVSLQATARGNDLQYSWSPAMGLSDTAVLQPTITPERDMTYVIKAQNTQGCIGTDEVNVKVIPELYIPNAFTPNGDGHNDYWQVPFLESFPGAEVRVFSRYGQQIFYTLGNAARWDGRLGGKALPIGAYVYLVDLKNGSILRGTVLLLR